MSEHPIPSPFGQHNQQYDSAQGPRVNNQFAATMNAKKSNNFGTGGQMTSLIKSPQQ